MAENNNKHTDNQQDETFSTEQSDLGNDNLAENEEISEDLSVEDELGNLQQQLEEQKDKFIRLYAEFDNYKKRTAREKIELIQTAGKDVIISLLEVVDDFERAEKNKPEGKEADAFQEGLLLTFNKLKSTLANKGLKPIETIGKEFNADEQEAIAQVPVPDENQKGKVIDEVVKGYYLNDKIIRFAKVVVGQ